MRHCLGENRRRQGCALPRSEVAAMMPGQMMPMPIAASATALARET
jgi:hypothetical protein